MKIIIGLGNPGQTYFNTRHNIGFEFLDNLQSKFDFPAFSFNKKFNAEISEDHIGSQKIILAKPQTFMNLSGTAARAILDFYKLTPEDIIVIQDDIDIAIGTFKLASDSRSAGHNGVQNIIDRLGTQKFTRLRIGVGNAPVDSPACRLEAHPPRVDKRSPRVEAGDFVLGKFSQAESEKIISIFPDLLQALLHQID